MRCLGPARPGGCQCMLRGCSRPGRAGRPAAGPTSRRQSNAPPGLAQAAAGAAAPAALKEEGNRAFAKKEYERALECYDKALKVAADATESALLHSNKAACHMMGKK